MEGRWACDENADRSTVKVEFNVDAAIQTLRAAGFYDNALYLAKRHERHAQFCEIQVEDIDNAKAAMTLGKDMTFRDFAQAAWRMRGIGAGQTIELVLVPEVSSLISADAKTLGLSRTASPVSLLRETCAWLLINSMRSETLQFRLLCEHN